MSNLIGRLLVVLVLGWAGSASAIPITDIVMVDGREWAQPIELKDHSWNEFNNACPGGVCGGLIGSTDVNGWTWATSADVAALFNSFIGSNELVAPIDSYSVAYNSPWADAFTTVFLSTYYGDWIDGVWGVTNDVLPGAPGSAETGTLAKLNDYYKCCGVDVASIGRAINKNEVLNTSGAWMYRDPSAAPTPATLPLLGIGLAAMGYSLRKRNLQSKTQQVR